MCGAHQYGVACYINDHANLWIYLLKKTAMYVQYNTNNLDQGVEGGLGVRGREVVSSIFIPYILMA